MSGGIYGEMNKKLPGAYANVKSARHNIVAGAGERGVVFTALTGLGWGIDGVLEVTGDSDARALLGHDLTSPKLEGLRMVLSNARKAIVYNVNPGEPAKSQEDARMPFKLTAKHNGEIGNDLQVSIAPDSKDMRAYVVKTTMGTEVVDTQTIKKASEFVSTSYIVVELAENADKLLGEIATAISVSFSGGKTGSAMQSMKDIQKAVETYEFNTLVAPNSSDTSMLHGLLADTAVRMRDEQGRKVQAVVPMDEDAAYDTEAVIAVANSLVLNSGKQLTLAESAGFVAGATASASVNESLTYRVVPGASDVSPRVSDEEAEAIIANGGFLFTAQRGAVKVLMDINSFHTFTAEKGHEFSKNRPLRVLDTILNTVRETWEDSFVGKVTNDEEGRDLFKATLAEFLSGLQAQSAIIDYSIEDLTVTAGDTKDSVIVNLAVTTADSMEKLYMTVVSR